MTDVIVKKCWEWQRQLFVCQYKGDFFLGWLAPLFQGPTPSCLMLYIFGCSAGTKKPQKWNNIANIELKFRVCFCHRRFHHNRIMIAYKLRIFAKSSNNLLKSFSVCYKLRLWSLPWQDLKNLWESFWNMMFRNFNILKTVVFTICFLITKNDDLRCRYNPYLYTWLKVRFSSFNSENWQQIALSDLICCYSYS